MTSLPDREQALLFFLVNKSVTHLLYKHVLSAAAASRTEYTTELAEVAVVGINALQMGWLIPMSSSCLPAFQNVAVLSCCCFKQEIFDSCC